MICSKGRLARPLYLHEQACLCRLNNLTPKIDRVKVIKFFYDRYPVPFPWDVGSAGCLPFTQTSWAQLFETGFAQVMENLGSHGI